MAFATKGSNFNIFSFWNLMIKRKYVFSIGGEIRGCRKDHLKQIFKFTGGIIIYCQNGGGRGELEIKFKLYNLISPNPSLKDIASFSLLRTEASR